jgi:hypothetical protein
MRIPASALAVAAALLLGAGCETARRSGPAVVLPEPTLAELVAAHNAWAESIQRIWSRAKIGLVLPEEAGSEKRARYDMDGHLFLEKPDRMLLSGKVLGFGEVFRVGLNPERFWLWVGLKVNTVWYGARGGPGESRAVIAPEALMKALGVFPVDVGPRDRAALEFHGLHAVLTETAVGSRRLVRRVWFDRITNRPARIDLFDSRGERILMAELLAYEPVGGADLCTTYRVRFRGEEEVDLTLRLEKTRLDKSLNPRIFEYRVPPGARERDLDRPPDLSRSGAPGERHWSA